LDFVEWSSRSDARILWLSGASEPCLSEISSNIIDEDKNTSSTTKDLALYFFSETVAPPDLQIPFIHTILDQIVRCSPEINKASIMHCFLDSLLEKFSLSREPTIAWRKLVMEKKSGRNEKDTRVETLQKFLHGPKDILWSALLAVLTELPQQGSSLLIDGVHKFEHESQIELVKFVRYFQQRQPEATILLTGAFENMDALRKGRLQYLQIEYDKERQGTCILTVSWC
jgi:hypothetical protein